MTEFILVILQEAQQSQ